MAATEPCSLQSALNDSAHSITMHAFTSGARFLQVRRSCGRDIPRVRCRQQRGTFIHTVGGHCARRAADSTGKQQQQRMVVSVRCSGVRGIETVTGRRSQTLKDECWDLPLHPPPSVFMSLKIFHLHLFSWGRDINMSRSVNEHCILYLLLMHAFLSILIAALVTILFFKVVACRDFFLEHAYNPILLSRRLC